ncbi:Hypothetical predicted protein [Lecanosticta acicola]|uniref:Uncharacterized protein n=1 Tax=Lecanosticta acicola TaxID=111012 RepID=A0AAI8W227_9PEZI|nr:Hypothetical predicted protein [Lecanosticta acicola]
MRLDRIIAISSTLHSVRGLAYLPQSTSDTLANAAKDHSIHTQATARCSAPASFSTTAAPTPTSAVLPQPAAQRQVATELAGMISELLFKHKELEQDVRSGVYHRKFRNDERHDEETFEAQATTEEGVSLGLPRPPEASFQTWPLSLDLDLDEYHRAFMDWGDEMKLYYVELDEYYEKRREMCGSRQQQGA